MVKYILPFVAAALLVSACNKDDRPCTDEYKPGPAVVTIECAETALGEDLGEEALHVEYSYDGTQWETCHRYHRESHDGGARTPMQPVCDANKPFTPRFECGGRSGPQIAGEFYIRAAQGTRSAGPIRITTRMKDHCHYDEATLNHELHLDLNEI